MARLTSFSISNSGDTYVIHMTTEEGQSLDFEADYDQLDLMAEAIDERLDADEEEALSVEDDG